MAALNFPDPAVTQEFEAAGILWTWNATLGVWSSETTTAFDAGELYLSKRNDDAADGNIEFRGLTTHQQGVQLPNLTNTASLATDVDGNIIAGTGGGGGGLTEGDANALYLSKTTDDVAQGAITFQGTTTHENGIHATGGEILAGNNPASGANNGTRIFGTGGVFVSTASGTSNIWRGFTTGTAAATSEISANGNAKFVQLTLNGNITGAGNITGRNAEMLIKPGDGSRKNLTLTGGGDATDTERGAVSIGNSINGNIRFRCRADSNYGFYKPGDSNIGYLNFDAITSGRTYSFPNWNGQVVVSTSGGPNAATRFLSITADNTGWFKNKIVGHPSNGNFTAQGNTSGTGLTWDGVRLAIARNDSSAHNSPVWVNRSGRSGKDGAFIRFQFDGTDPDQTEIKGQGQGKIQFRGLVNSYRTDMDARKVGDSLTEITNATALVKALEPKREGFVAQKLGRLISHAVDSLDENQTLDLGTHTLADGTVLTRVAQPEAIPYGETWEKTETYDLPVGVSDASLIPFLTKALQEALERIEVLEAAASG